MKKILSLSTTLVILVAMNLTVFAASNTYHLDELGLRVTIPSGYSVITKDTPANDPIFYYLNTTKSNILTQFEESHIYLNAISDTYNEEVVITMTENSLSNFSLLSDTVLDTLASSLSEQYIEYGISISKYEIYKHTQAKFVKIYFTDIAETVHGLQYYTVYNGKAMNFTMRSYEGNISSRQESVIKAIINSIKYNEAPPAPAEGKNTAAFTHTDPDSGVTFTVPANWERKEFTKDREYIDVKFVSTKEDGCTIIYGSTDMWSMMSTTEKLGSTRSDINNAAFTKSDIAEMYDITADRISIVTYNGTEYFKCELTHSSNTYGFAISVTMTQLVYINNGWGYTFQFGGTDTHKMYSDFEKLLNSVHYPVTPPVASYETSSRFVESSSDSELSDNNSGNNAGIIAVILVLLIPTVVVVLVLLHRDKKANPVDNSGDKEERVSPALEPQDKSEQNIFCTNCGQKLPSESAFCHICGNKINKES